MSEPPDYASFAEASVLWLAERNDSLRRDYGIGHFERFDVNLNIGMITFSAQGIVRVQAEFHPIGSLSSTSDTWLWAWANFNLPPRMRGLSKKARRYGQEHVISELTEAKWPAVEDDAWRVTSVAARLIGADGAYACPMTHVVLFGVLLDIARAA